MSNNKPEKLTDIKCCGQAVLINRDAVHPDTKEKGVGIWCDKCGINAIHEIESTAIEMIKAEIANKEKEEQEAIDSQGELDLSRDKDQKPPKEIKDGKQTTPRYDNVKKESKKVNKPQTQNTAIAVIPKNPRELEIYFQSNQSHLIEITSPVIGEKSAMLRLINNNMRYVQNAKQLKEVWTSLEGQESIIHETEEAMMMGAELGKMGDLVPYGKTCEFIPSVEAYEFSLTNGKNAPFSNITIECIHENDDIKVGRKDGDFYIDFSFGIPRGEVKAVAVYGVLKKTGNITGELYDKERLMEKAEIHSVSYRYFLQDKNRAEQLRTEGKLKSLNGREYYEKEIPKKDGGSWKKKIFLDELSNPYEGADQPEMLRKTAGKSFMRKYARVRNSEAAMDEVRSHKKAVERSFDLADGQFSE